MVGTEVCNHRSCSSSILPRPRKAEEASLHRERIKQVLKEEQRGKTE
jgi:hypothetical protein